MTQQGRAGREPGQVPRVSVGLPVYQGERFVQAAIDSILGQDHHDLELVISDNGSTDGTEAICRAAAARDPRVRYLRADTNRGAAWNFDNVFHQSRGELFKWVAADDVYAPSWVSRCVEALDADPGVVLAYTRALDIDEDGNVFREWEPMPHATDDRPSVRFSRLTVELGRCFSIFGLTRRTVLEQTGLHRPYAAADRVLLAELALRGRFVEIDEPLYLHREHQDRSVRQRGQRQLAGWMDPAREGSITLPAWRQTAEFVRAVREAPLPPGERLRAYAGLNRWLRAKWKVHVGNLYDAGRDVLAGVAGRRPALTRA